MFIVVTQELTGIMEAFNVSTVKRITPSETGTIINVNGQDIQVKESFKSILDQLKPIKKLF